MIASLGERSPEALACFPKGRIIFRTARDDELATWLTTLAEGVTTYQAALGTALVTQATDLRAAWAAIYADSETATGAKAASEEEKRALRRELQWVLYQNLLAIVALYPRQPERAALYMQPHLLGFPQGGGGSSGGDDDDESSGLTS